jgi:hypothetical protein
MLVDLERFLDGGETWCPDGCAGGVERRHNDEDIRDLHESLDIPLSKETGDGSSILNWNDLAQAALPCPRESEDDR